MTGFKTERRRLKPMMERKRRARINRSLEQLKDVIVDSNGGILPRLDKARILELTVEYLQKKSLRGHASTGDERFQAGYIRCANEVTSFLHDKVDDGKLTQIIQYLFTLTATLKRQTDGIPRRHQSQASTSVLRKQKVATSPGKMSANVPIHGSESHPTTNQHHSTKSSLCVFKSKIATTCQQTGSRNEDIFQKSSLCSAKISLKNNIPRQIIQNCSNMGVNERSRSQHHGSVCSSTASGPSVDVDSSSDDEVFTRRHDRLPQPAVKWMDADDNETGSCEISDSDNDSNTSDVCYMDCQSASDNERDSSLNINNNSNNKNNNNIDNMQENERSLSDRHDNRQDPTGPMWRPW